MHVSVYITKTALHLAVVLSKGHARTGNVVCNLHTLRLTMEGTNNIQYLDVIRSRDSAHFLALSLSSLEWHVPQSTHSLSLSQLASTPHNNLEYVIGI